MSDPTPPHEPLDPRPAWQDSPAALWRTAVALGLFVVLYSVLLTLWFIAVSPVTAMHVPGRQGLTLLMLFSFIAAILSLELVMRLLHGRGLASLVGDAPLALRQGGRVLLYAVPVLLVISALPMPEAVGLRAHLAPGQWAAWLPLGLLAVAVQITSEELLFRGYVQSRLRARAAHPLWWLVLPAVLFGALHYDGGAGANAPWIVASAIAFGLSAGDLTARSGTLGPALALHFLNNCIAILGVSFGDELGGLALYHLTVTQSDPALRAVMPVELASTGVLWLAARLALRR